MDEGGECCSSTAVLVGTSSLALIIAMVWVLTVRSEAPIRVVAVIGILAVQALGIWLVRTARSPGQGCAESASRLLTRTALTSIGSYQWDGAGVEMG